MLAMPREAKCSLTEMGQLAVVDRRGLPGGIRVVVKFIAVVEEIPQFGGIGRRQNLIRRA
jgi:hypothetical protein